jgi:hypothetical protein
VNNVANSRKADSIMRSLSSLTIFVMVAKETEMTSFVVRYRLHGVSCHATHKIRGGGKARDRINDTTIMIGCLHSGDLLDCSTVGIFEIGCDYTLLLSSLSSRIMVSLSLAGMRCCYTSCLTHATLYFVSFFSSHNSSSIQNHFSST